MGVITDPRTLPSRYPRVREPETPLLNTELLMKPLPPEKAHSVELIRGPNIATLPNLEPLADELELPVLLKLGDDISTDEIMPAGARVLPYRSNIPKISEFAFNIVDENYPKRAMQTSASTGHAIVAGRNYGQGSSREHAALAPRYLGLRLVIAKQFARIHWQNLVNFGVLPLCFADPSDYEHIEQGDVLKFRNLREQLVATRSIPGQNVSSGRRFTVCHDLSERQIHVLRVGGLITWVRNRLSMPD